MRIVLLVALISMGRVLGMDSEYQLVHSFLRLSDMIIVPSALDSLSLSERQQAIQEWVTLSAELVSRYGYNRLAGVWGCYRDNRLPSVKSTRINNIAIPPELQRFGNHSASVLMQNAIVLYLPKNEFEDRILQENDRSNDFKQFSRNAPHVLQAARVVRGSLDPASYDYSSLEQPITALTNYIGMIAAMIHNQLGGPPNARESSVYCLNRRLRGGI